MTTRGGIYGNLHGDGQMANQTYGMFTQQQIEHALERCNLMLADPFLTPGAWVATFRQMQHYGALYNERWAPKPGQR